jgi:uncharacterized protein YeaO (DUF488 family)
MRSLKMSQTLQLKPAQELPSASDSCRTLVDRLWRRGVGHESKRWPVFRGRYLSEPKFNAAEGRLRQAPAAGPATLVCGANDREHNDAIILADFTEGEV